MYKRPSCSGISTTSTPAATLYKDIEYLATKVRDANLWQVFTKEYMVPSIIVWTLGLNSSPDNQSVGFLSKEFISELVHNLVETLEITSKNS